MATRRGDHGPGGPRGAGSRGTPLPAGSAGVRSPGSSLRSLPRDLRDLISVHTARGALVEAAWLSVHVAMYPFGVLRDRHEPSERYHLGDLAPHQRGLVVGDIEAAGTPILLVHGMIDNRMIFAVLRRRLRRRGFGKVFTINYSPATNDIRAAARDLSGAIEELVARTGYERIHVIGHSLGGLIARYYVQRLGGDERVHTLVTLGSPHGGSLLAYGLPVQLGRQLRPGSELYVELARPVPACRTRFVAYYSNLDQLVVPHLNGRIEHPDLAVRNIAIHAVGHMSLPIHPPVVREIGALLSQLDSHGATVTPGVTQLNRQGTAPA
ncbi:MAG: alpha/beta fold hydrolase [Kineosporiaceae bacterium]